MILNPRPGQRVLIWYRPVLRDVMPYHGRQGTVVVVSRGKPRNHGVLIDGRMIVFSCGNLRKVPGPPAAGG
jgi:hypothetical protein